MLAKVVRISVLAENGYKMAGLERHRDGSVRVRLANGKERADLHFAFYELPALEQACDPVGQGG
jgi:hypothetical protein